MAGVLNGVHNYEVQVVWDGNRGTGTSSYRAYGREHTVSAAGKPDIAASADRTFHGNADRWNPEEFLLTALSECHMLSYLHAAVRAGVTVVAYTDAASGTMVQTGDGGGHFTEARLRPQVTVADPAQVELAQSLHAEAARECFIAASVNFPVLHDAHTGVANFDAVHPE